jgi:hypothetical protein
MRPILNAYPAHCHINIAAGFGRGGVGSELFASFENRLRQRCVRGIHVSASSEDGRAFFLKKGFTVLASYAAPRLHVDIPKEIYILGRQLF